MHKSIKMHHPVLHYLHDTHMCGKPCLPSSARPRHSGNAKGRLPELTAWYEGKNTPGLFVLGTAAHSRDYRLSSGGFIHGFRYTGERSNTDFDSCCISVKHSFYNLACVFCHSTDCPSRT